MNTSSKPTRQRKAREAEALRSNLQRRKEQLKARKIQAQEKLTSSLTSME